MDDLRVTIIQSHLHWENKAKNLEMFSQKISAITESTDLIVLPEMFTTGFSMRPEKFAEKMDGTTVSWMQEKAFKKKCAIVGSFIAEENGLYFNRLVWMNEGGIYHTYDKRHLFRMGKEDKHYGRGTKKLIVELRGWRVCPLICYDLRFPVWSRNTLQIADSASEIPSYDLLLYVTNWPEKRNHPWKTLLLARAIENQSYVIGLNRVGMDGHEVYHSGDSAVINAKGDVISKIKPHEEATETVMLNYSELEGFRKEFPVLPDADIFSIENH